MSAMVEETGRRVIELLTNSMGPEMKTSQDTTKTSRSRKSLVKVGAIFALSG